MLLENSLFRSTCEGLIARVGVIVITDDFETVKVAELSTTKILSNARCAFCDESTHFPLIVAVGASKAKAFRLKEIVTLLLSHLVSRGYC